MAADLFVLGISDGEGFLALLPAPTSAILSGFVYVGDVLGCRSRGRLSCRRNWVSLRGGGRKHETVWCIEPSVVRE